MSIKEFINKLRISAENTETPDESYVEKEIDKIKEEDVEILLENEEAINKKFLQTKGLSKYAALGKTMFSMIKDIKSGTYKNVPWSTIATIVVALLYVFNPLDVIPDFIPGLGFIDDIAVLTIGLGWIESDINRYLEWKKEQEHS